MLSYTTYEYGLSFCPNKKDMGMVMVIVMDIVMVNPHLSLSLSLPCLVHYLLDLGPTIVAC